MLELTRDAVLSDCGRYRYRLTRRWNGKLRPLTFVMMNPSTADAAADDPTTRRCMGLAHREHAGGIVVVNLFAYRATNPDDLRAIPDPCGPGNADALLEAIVAAGQTPIVCAWGTKGILHNGDRRFLDMAQREGASLVALGITTGGHPQHPLYARANQPLADFTGRS